MWLTCFIIAAAAKPTAHIEKTRFACSEEFKDLGDKIQNLIDWGNKCIKMGRLKSYPDISKTILAKEFGLDVGELVVEKQYLQAPKFK